MALAKRGYGRLESVVFDTLSSRIARPFHERGMARIMPRVGPSSRILDVGCGGGGQVIQLANAFRDAEVVGVDVSPEMIARARRRVGTATRPTFVEGSALDLPFASHRFDIVCSFGSLKHWPDPEQGLRECARVLAPGGWMCILEGDSNARPEDLRALMAAWGLPRLLRPIMGEVFRRGVAGASFDVPGARALLRAIPDIEATVERVEGVPAWAIEGHRVA